MVYVANNNNIWQRKSLAPRNNYYISHLMEHCAAVYTHTHTCIHFHRLSLKVCGLTCDGLSANRRFFKLHDPSSKIVYKVPNPYAEDNRQLYSFSDPPHLLKTTRNGWASTKRRLWVSYMYMYVFTHNTVRKLVHFFLQCNGKEILWDHLRELYRKDSGAHKNAAGLCLVPKLKYEHVFLTSFSKMRVDLAAQVCTHTYVFSCLLYECMLCYVYMQINSYASSLFL